MRKFVSALALGAGMIAATSASAQVTAINYDDAALGGDGSITISYDGQLTGIQILAELDTGTFVYGPEVFPTSTGEGQTFATFGLAPVTFSTVPSIAGGAVDLGGSSGLINDATTFDIAIFLPDSQQNATNQDQSGYLAGRIGTQDGFGTLRVLASAGGQIASEDFVIGVPEPTTAGLLGLAGLSLIARRRKTA